MNFIQDKHNMYKMPEPSNDDQKCKKTQWELAKELKRDLESWRELIIPIYGVLLWEKKWHPGMLIATSSFIFLHLWIMDPSVLTTISIFGIFIALVDYVAPRMTACLCHPDSWTGIKERKLEEFSMNLAAAVQYVTACFSSFYCMRQSRPTMYFSTVVLVLGPLGWIGNEINNLLLTYLVVTTLILLPGIKYNGVGLNYFHELYKYLRNPLKKFKGKTH